MRLDQSMASSERPLILLTTSPISALPVDCNERQLARPYDWSTKLIVGLHPRAVFHLRLQVALHETTPPRGRGQPPGTAQ